MILVAAHRRSGTRYTAALLRRFGLDVKANRLGRDGTSSWIHVGRGRYKDRVVGDDVFDLVLHQVRHPLDVISSARIFGSKASVRFLQENIPRGLPVLPGNELRFAMTTWVAWNRKIEAMSPASRVRVEDLSTAFPGLVPNNHKSRKHIYGERLTWDDLEAEDPTLAAEIREMAASYGYR